MDWKDTFQLLHGYLNNYGHTLVQHQFQADRLFQAPVHSHTTVLAIEARQATIWHREWEQIQACYIAKDLREYLASNLQLSMMDAWRMKHEHDRFTCLIRVRTTDVASWLLADYPLVISVTGPAHEQYRV
eukprot:3169142-Amphidinium_carterae.1